MAAKPVIDILAEVKDISDADRFSPRLEALGYEAKGENGIEGRRFFQKGGNKRTHHVHIYETGHPDVKRHLLFRDYLTAKPEKAAQYMELKRHLAKTYPYDMAKYSEGKMTGSRRLNKRQRTKESGRCKESRNNAYSGSVCYNGENEKRRIIYANTCDGCGETHTSAGDGRQPGEKRSSAMTQKVAGAR